MPNQPRRELQDGTPVRSVRVPDKYWKQWDLAARIAGVSRSKFIITVCNHAAHTILEEQGQDPKEV